MKKRVNLAVLGMAALLLVSLFYCPMEGKAADVIEGFHGGKGTAKDPYQIATVEEFEILRGNGKSDDGYDRCDFLNTYFVLTKDIHYHGKVLPSTSQWGFARCHIDGKGHTVSGIRSTDNPLFYRVDETEITNIGFKDCVLKNTPLISKDISNSRLSNITVTKSQFVFDHRNWKDSGDAYGGTLNYGGLANFSYATKNTNITVDGEMKIHGYGFYGMLYGFARQDCEAKGCKTSGKIKATVLYDKDHKNTLIGGMIGNNEGRVSNSLNRAKISVNLPAKDVSCSVAGISGTGSCVDEKKKGYRYDNCRNQGNIHISSKLNRQERQMVYAAGISAGYTDGDVKNCKNSGKITTRNAYAAAGIVNDLDGSIVNCQNKGRIEAVDTASLAGIVNTAMKKVSGCFNSGEIKVRQTKIHYDRSGGAAGIVNRGDTDKRNVTIRKCSNSGKITADSKKWHAYDAAGIVNWLGQTKSHTSTIVHCRNSGTIAGDGWVQGIVNMSGNWAVKGPKVWIRSCINTGSLYTKDSGDVMPGILGYAMNTKVKGCKNKGPIKSR